MSAYISFTNYHKDDNKLTWLNYDKEENYTARVAPGKKLDFKINSKFNLICSLKRKEKNKNNLNCANFKDCNDKYCIDDNVGLICNKGKFYGKLL